MSTGKKSASKRHPLYQVWRMMHRRCEDKTHMHFKNYGGRGIFVCEEWKLFWTFAFDMGQRPAGATLDRIENDGPYAPWNCKWSTRLEQAQNRRNMVLIEYMGERLTKAAWARKLKISNSGFDRRLKRHGLEAAIQMGGSK